MRITIVLAILTFSFTLLGGCFEAIAESATPSANLQAEQLINQTKSPELLLIGSSKISPSSLFYFLKTVREGMENSLAGSSDTQARRQLEFAHRRLREVKALIGPREDLIEATLEKYKYHLQFIKKRAASEEVKLETAQLIAQYNVVLANLYDSLSDKQAKRAIMVAIITGEEEIGKLSSRLEDSAILDKNIMLERAATCRVLIKGSDEKEFNDTVREELRKKAIECQQNYLTLYGIQ